MDIGTLFLGAAVIAFLLDAFRVAAAVSWTPLGYALVVIGALLL